MIYPDYVIHGNTLYGDSQLVFSSDCIKIECSDASGSDEKFASEWAVSDIVHIDCRWSGTVSFLSCGRSFFFVLHCSVTALLLLLCYLLHCCP